MFEKKCDQCSVIFSIPLNYSAPFVKCPECGSHQRYKKPEDKDQPEYRIGKANVSTQSLKTPAKIIDDSKIIEDAVGSDGLKEIYNLVAIYMVEPNVIKRRSLKSKTMQGIMKRLTISADLTSQALSYAEKASETQEIIAARHRKKLLVISVTAALCAALLLGLLLAFL